MAGHRLFPAFWLLAAKGMRRSELLGLCWDEIDLGKGNHRGQPGMQAETARTFEKLITPDVSTGDGR